MRAIHALVLIAAGLGASAHAADGQGFTAPASLSSASGLWSATAAGQWRGRLALGFSSLALPAAGAGLGTGPRPALASARLLGDYYFAQPALGDRARGLRATSGLILGPRLGAWAAGDAVAPSSALSIERSSFGLLPTLDMARAGQATVPYLGLGYNDRPLRSGWGFSADVGVMALRPSSGLRLDRGGVPTVDDVQRDLRLAPVLQLGASYAF